MKKLNEQIARMREIMDLDEKSPGSYDRNMLIDYFKNIAKELGQPEPTSELDTGSNALVFNTTNPDILMRAEEVDDGEDPTDLKEYILDDDDIQETGGVAKIYHIDLFKIGEEEYLVSWKEKVEENYQHHIYTKYGEQANEVLGALNLYDPFRGRENIKKLKGYPETNKLYNAIMVGLPTGDLAYDSNIGMNKNGDIVAFDI